LHFSAKNGLPTELVQLLIHTRIQQKQRCWFPARYLHRVPGKLYLYMTHDVHCNNSTRVACDAVTIN
jgi:hypothetical protein